MLFFLYKATSGFPAFHRFGFRFVRNLEFPILRLIFTLAGAKNAILRHSANHGRDFNVFVSDIDLSVVCETLRFHFIHQLATGLKKVFINMGEVEFYTPEEWMRMEELLSDPKDEFWNRLLLLRKLSWQLKSLALCGSNSYQKAKIERGIKLTRKRLNLQHEHWTLDEIFPEMCGGNPEQTPCAEYSKFLERELVFRDSAAARNFWSILPDSRNIPNSYTRKELKLYILKRELFLALVSIRSHMLTGKITDLEEKKEWIEDLQNRIDSFSELSPGP